MAEEIRVPNLGESVTEAIVAKWLKAEGEAVAADEPVAELETDKVAVEVNAPAAGVLVERRVAEGDTVEVGSVIALIDPEGTARPAAAQAGKAAKPEKAKEKPAGPAAEPSETVDIVVPSAGESVTEATLAAWHKAEGEAVAEDETVAELETDKAALEINAPVAGVLVARLVEEGGTVHPGDVIGRIAKGAAAKAAAGAVAAKVEAAPVAPAAADEAAQPLAPAVRRLLAEYDLDPASISGTGKDGRITKADVLRAIEAGTAHRRGAPAAAAAPAPASAAAEGATQAPPREERVPMTRLRKRIAERLKEAQNTAAMLTTFNDVDMSAVIAARQRHREVFERKHGIKLGFMSFFVKAAVLALREVPQVNARIEDDEIVYQNFYDIGVAVSAPQGLVVPVVRDADRLSFADTEKAIAEYGRKARDGKLSIADLQGGTFTISNGGIFGSLLSTPILNPPQSGILGMHRIQERPVVQDGEIVIRPMMYLALSYDHRLVDGREAVTFLVRIKEAIEDPNRLLLDL